MKWDEGSVACVGKAFRLRLVPMRQVVPVLQIEICMFFCYMIHMSMSWKDRALLWLQIELI